MSRFFKQPLDISLAELRAGKERVVFVIKGKSGKDISNISFYGKNYKQNRQEGEITHKRGSDFYVKAIDETKPNEIIIYFEE